VRFPSLLPPAAGIGLKPEHYRAVLGLAAGEATNAAGDTPATTSTRPGCRTASPGWVEVHPQNYFGDGGPPHRWLAAVAQQYPLSFHSVGLSLGSAAGVNRAELDALALLCERYEPAQVSDHLSWSGSANNRFPDLLPVPYTQEALDHFAGEVSRVQDRLGRTILIENPSRYLAFAHDEMDEGEFMAALCARSGCGILLDVNNIEVSAANLGLDPFVMLAAIDPALVGEIHVAGHKTERHDDGALLIDDHGSPASDLTWRLLAAFVARAGPRPVLFEWDTDVPDYAVLMAEAAKADGILAGAEARDAA
jgi:uncharacterized protein (UPF0276 family)